uniref:Uncharacterized protein n=1 Tax=Ciona savignyi TaxID=51511 RepID=H2Z3J3_CIOSA
MPSYGMNRQCFQVYTKDGMNNLLNSKSRRSKLTQMGNGKYVNKHGITLFGPFWTFLAKWVRTGLPMP